MDSKTHEDKSLLEKLLIEGSTSEEDMTKRQWQILEAAIKVFSEKGFEGSRTSDIAKEADVAEGTIFRYYKTKKDLLMGLLIPLITKFFRPLVIQSAEAIIKNEDKEPIDKVVKNLFIDRLELIEKNFPLIKTVFIEAMYHPELLEIIQRDLASKVIPFINGFVEGNIKEGNFRNIDPILITRTTMSMLLGYIVFTRIFPDFFNCGGDREDEIKDMVDVLLKGIGNSKK